MTCLIIVLCALFMTKYGSIDARPFGMISNRIYYPLEVGGVVKFSEYIAIDITYRRSSHRDERDESAIEMNGGHIPYWPVPKRTNETIMYIPKRLRSGDEIIVYGKLLPNKQILNVSLVTGRQKPDYNNIACEVVANFSTKLIANVIKDGVVHNYTQGNNSSEVITSDEFNIYFRIDEEHELTIKLEGFDLDPITLLHNIGTIKYLSISGSVQKISKLYFNF